MRWKRWGGRPQTSSPWRPPPPRPESPLEAAATGGREEMVVVGEEVEEEMECGPSDSALALLFEDNPGPDVYVRMDTDPANAPLLPMPTALPPPPLGSCERRHCRFHAAEGVHEHRLSDHGQRPATSLAGDMERFELQLPGRVAWEVALADVAMLGDQVCCAQLGDTSVLDYHPGG